VLPLAAQRRQRHLSAKLQRLAMTRAEGSIMSIITHVLLTIFATVLASGETVRDLCDVVNKRTGGPIYCEPHSEGAPIYDSTVCCDGGSCFAAPRGRCPTDQQLFYCEFGEQWATGEVACYVEVLEFCDVFACPHEPPPGYSWYPQADNICCQGGICVSGANWVRPSKPSSRSSTLQARMVAAGHEAGSICSTLRPVGVGQHGNTALVRGPREQPTKIDNGRKKRVTTNDRASPDGRARA
jgi:hypothetical protein